MQTRPDGRDRGQVIIVAALVIAATFVGLALVLNSGIYAENLSSRETTDTEGALSFTLATDEAVAEAYERTNRNGSATAEEARTTFDGTMDAWETAQQRRGANQGIGVDVERTAHVGWRLNQSVDREFSPSGSSDSDWQLVDDADAIAEFELEVEQSNLHSPTTAVEVSDSFQIEVSGVDVWNLYIFRNDSETVAFAGDPGDHASLDDLLSDTDSCSADSSPTTIDHQNESIGGTPCPALNFSDNVSGEVDIAYANGDRVSGTYELAVNGSDAVATDGSGYPEQFDTPDGGSDPNATAIVYSASYATHYGRTDLTHERNGTHMVRNETHAS